MEPFQNKLARDADKITFHPEQVRWLEELFPEIVHTPNRTPAEMYHQGGIRTVVLAVRSKMR